MTAALMPGPLADALRYFPLVPRRRPLGLALDARVSRLTELAASADVGNNLVDASGVHNLTALLAADRGLPDLARTLCLNHANLYLSARPLPPARACLALEPLVNLALLRIREADGDAAMGLIERLAHAVATDGDAVLDGTPVPLAGLTVPGPDRDEVAAWLDNVLVYDGARALVRAGRWVDAHLHLKLAGGIARRMFDGRQIAVIAVATEGHIDLARSLLADSPTEEPWEDAVTAALTAACSLLAGQPCPEQARAMLSAHQAVGPGAGTLIFDTRLALTVADLAAAAGLPGHGRQIFTATVDRVLAAPEGYSARDLLTHPRADHLPAARRQQLAAAMATAGLGVRRLPTDLEDRIGAALALATSVITRTTTADKHPRQTQPTQHRTE
ncbi:hypothetical protein [Kitasatospora sp. NPDC092286]|uniref:hypothetical protein n=1 Tax=Kitasatospora sp. NPDC092286 TaxID=3364087 RepID=UPI003811C1A9